MSHLDEERLTALLDGELSAIEAKKARDHIAECAECAARFEEVKGFFTEADRLVQVLSFPPAVVPAAPAPVPAPAAKPRRPLPLKQLAWAASLVLAVGFGYYGDRLTKQQQAPAALKEVDGGKQLAASADTQLSDARKAAGATQPATPPATPPVSEPSSVLQSQAPRPSTADDKLATKANKDEPTRESQSQPSPAANTLGELSANEKSRDQGAARQALSSALDNKPAGGRTAPAEQAGKRADSALTDGDAMLRRERAEAEARGFAAKTDMLPPVAAAAPASAGFRAAPIPPPVKVTMEQAIQALGGTIHLIDGMSPDRVEQLTARAVPGAHAGLPVIRVIYVDPPMREIWLDQQRGLGASAPRDTIMQWTPDGGQNMQWMTGTDDWLSLTAHLTADSVRSIAKWVR